MEFKRSPNITIAEKTILFDLVCQHKDIIENKQTDKVTNA